VSLCHAAKAYVHVYHMKPTVWECLWRWCWWISGTRVPGDPKPADEGSAKALSATLAEFGQSLGRKWIHSFY